MYTPFPHLLPIGKFNNRTCKPTYFHTVNELMLSSLCNSECQMKNNQKFQTHAFSYCALPKYRLYRCIVCIAYCIIIALYCTYCCMRCALKGWCVQQTKKHHHLSIRKKDKMRMRNLTRTAVSHLMFTNDWVVEPER